MIKCESKVQVVSLGSWLVLLVSFDLWQLTRFPPIGKRTRCRNAILAVKWCNERVRKIIR